MAEKGKCSQQNDYLSLNQQYFNSLSIGYSIREVTKVKIKDPLFLLCCINLFVVQINVFYTGLVLSPSK